MREIEIRVKLEGRHAEMYAALLAEANRAPGDPLDEHELAAALLRTFLDEDAADNAAEARH